MIEGSGSVSVPRTNESGRPKNIRIRLHAGSAPKCKVVILVIRLLKKLKYCTGICMKRTYRDVYRCIFNPGPAGLHSHEFLEPRDRNEDRRGKPAGNNKSDSGGNSNKEPQ